MDSEWTEVIKSKSKSKSQTSKQKVTKTPLNNDSLKTDEEMENINDTFENLYGQYICDSIYDISIEIEQYKPLFNIPSTFEIEEFFDYYINKAASVPEEKEQEEPEEELDDIDTYI